ncbi:LacI family DNA-binding transcriptional regulator [Kineococcus glutinatus]|uniref:LacI family DNA-binding transcriptional regulator n=1 Tax=Kineococcus glutinatus TaxID=1070872 RepID=A0ABP9HC56_9ACTN
MSGVTIHEVATRAGVSASTVSRAFTNPQLVRADTRDRVLQLARDLGYTPNRAARGLITGRTGNIGVVVPDLANPFFSAVLKGANARAREADQIVFLADTDEDPGVEEDLVRAMAKQVDGIVLCSSRMSGHQLHELMPSIPLVLLNRREDDRPAVLFDNVAGVRRLLAHLGALGHRRVAYLGGPRTSWSDRERRRGMRLAARREAVDLVELGPFEPTYEGGLRAADPAAATGATAVVAFNDLMALGVLNRLAARGVAVPGEVSVAGFDGIPTAGMGALPLTTVALPMVQAGRAAIDLLLERLADPDPDAGRLQRVLDVDLLVRSTTATPLAPPPTPPPNPPTADVQGGRP